MPGRKKDFDEEEVLKKASELFWKNGYCATNARTLSKEMDMNLGSIYYSFSNKKELFEKSFQHTTDLLIDYMEQFIKGHEDLKEGIKAFYIQQTKNPNSQDHQKGCFMGNTLIESAGTDESLKQLAVARIRKMEITLARLIILAKEKEQISQDKDEKLLAGYLVNTWHGLNISRRYAGGTQELSATIALSLKILD